MPIIISTLVFSAEKLKRYSNFLLEHIVSIQDFAICLVL